jgi:hypothetical protein
MTIRMVRVAVLVLALGAVLATLTLQLTDRTLADNNGRGWQPIITAPLTL